MEYLLRFALGGLAVLSITLLADKGAFKLGGIIMAFPVISMTSLLLTKDFYSAVELSKWGIAGLVSTASFFLGIILAGRLFNSLPVLMLAGIVFWFAVSLTILKF